MEPDNKLVIADYPSQIEQARQLIGQLDVPRQQIRITAMIYDLAVKDIERLGINWNQALKDRHDGSGNPQSIWNIDSVLSVPVSTGVADGTMAFMNLTRHFDITAVVQALQEAQDSRLLANPNVTVLDHEPALVSIITEIPYQELTETQQGGNIGTTNFREAGIKLEVTPHIASDATIRMDVNPTFSRLTGFTPGEQANPIIDRREAQTVVRVADRQVLVIGGLRQRNDTGSFNGLPYLKDIKKLNLGALFRGRDTEIRESELVVFIMPEIIPYTHVASCREGVALQYGQCLLDQVPTATGGRPPYRLMPCCPPVPMGGPRVHGTPYQPNTCPPPDAFQGTLNGVPFVPGGEAPLPCDTPPPGDMPPPGDTPVRGAEHYIGAKWVPDPEAGSPKVVPLPPVWMARRPDPYGMRFSQSLPADQQRWLFRPPMMATQSGITGVPSKVRR
jgi:general secretion pathway protein D